MTNRATLAVPMMDEDALFIPRWMRIAIYAWWVAALFLLGGEVGLIIWLICHDPLPSVQ